MQRTFAASNNLPVVTTFCRQGTLEPRTRRSGRRTLLTAGRRQQLEQLLSEYADATLAELGAGLGRRFRTSRIDTWLRKLGWRYKKTLAAAEQEWPDVAETRAQWCLRLGSHPVQRLVFID